MRKVVAVVWVLLLIGVSISTLNSPLISAQITLDVKSYIQRGVPYVLITNNNGFGTLIRLGPGMLGGHNTYFIPVTSVSKKECQNEGYHIFEFSYTTKPQAFESGEDYVLEKKLIVAVSGNIAIIKGVLKNTGNKEITIEQWPSHIHEGSDMLIVYPATSDYPSVQPKDINSNVRVYIGDKDLGYLSDVGLWNVYTPDTLTYEYKGNKVFIKYAGGDVKPIQLVTNGNPRDNLDFQGETVQLAPGETVEYAFVVSFTSYLPEFTQEQITRISCPFTQPQSPLENGLVAYYSFDHCDARDDSGNGHDGAIYGNPECIDGVIGKAFEFDGSQYIKLPDKKFLDGSYNVTISVWINYQANDNELHQIFASGDWRNGYDPITLQLMNNKPCNFGFEDTRHRGSEIKVKRDKFPVTFENHKWYLLTVILKETKNGSVMEIFINKDKVYEVHRDKKISIGYDVPMPTEIGAIHGTQRWIGYLDEVRIYNRALSEEEVKALYERESSTRSMESSTPTPSSTDEPSTRAYGGIIPFHSGFPLIAIVLLLLGIGGIGLKFNQRRALKASYLESINLIEEAEKSSFIDETRDILVKLQELRAELDDAYEKGNREKLSQIREEISQYASTVKEIYSKYSTTKEEVINQITNILTMGSSPGAGASMGGKDREG